MLSRRLIELYKADEIVFHQPRTMLQLGSLLHFCSQNLLEHARQSSPNYGALGTAIDKDSDKKLHKMKFGQADTSTTSNKG
jgi:hypothetical protein